MILNSNSTIDTINGISVNKSYIHTTNSNVRSSRDVKYIVIHYTGNIKDTALSNSKYFKNNYVGASAHLFVDNTSIYQSIDFKNIAWHCGASKYYHSFCRNSNSIGIEMCCTAGNYKVSETTINNTAYLCAHLCQMIGITANTVDEYVLRHYDVTHKSCPSQMAGDNNSNWNSFKSIVKSILSNNSAVNEVSNIHMVGVASTNLNIRSTYNSNGEILDQYNEGDTVCIVSKYNNGWYKVSRKGYYGYVSGNYVNIVSSHWASSYLSELVNKGFIENPEIWRNFEEPLTKSTAIALIDKMTGGTLRSNEADASIHWVQPIVISLCGKGIITSKEQWLLNPDIPISNALLLALIDKATGGTESLYIGRKVDHWGRNHLDSLCDKGIIQTPSAWRDFEGQVSRGSYMALCHKAFIQR